ncbi:hypothetical protein bsdtb5_18150 [Anaeromicropila herbilytica]|uniref:SdpI family protein n=1 Tax=Anaeromicropila herbilytica TaxID=2785025 RepID=A0A7R7EJZ5_9FIRM|nr:hypothetical protein bsdtb5_18150 [Anaeromicropila herbilytica]
MFDLVICALSFVILGIGFFAPEKKLSLCISGLIVYVLLIMIHIYAPKIAHLSEDNPKVKTMRRFNFFLMVFLPLAFTTLNWISVSNIHYQKNEEFFELIMCVALIVVFGNIAPKIPFNRYMGLRLPWTVRDEMTWKAAHKLLGIITFPIAFIIVIGSLMVSPKDFMIGGLIAWIVIPSTYSLYYYCKEKSKRENY